MSDRIVVLEHALERARERLAWADDGHLEERIRVDVRVALLLDRTTRVRPNWTRGEAASTAADDGHLFAWDGNATRCWVLDARDGLPVYVRSVLVASRLEPGQDERRRLRRGHRPA